MSDKYINANTTGIVLMLHGNSSSPRVFENLQIDFKTYKPVLPGHGEKGRKSDSFLSIDAFQKKLVNELNAMDCPIFIIGNSAGGHIAIEMAPEIINLKGLMIFGTPPVKKPINFDEAFISIPELQTFLTENPNDEEIDRAAQATLRNQNLKDVITDDFQKAHPSVRSHLLKNIQNGVWMDQSEIFKNLDCERFMVIPEHDNSINSVYLKNIASNSQGAVEIIEIKDCGHYPTLEKPEEMSTIINERVKRVFHEY